MIQIDRHIEILLLDNDCVIVPGLGGFMAHHIAARYYEDTQTYVPPIRQLGFNGQLKINDSLLAQSYIEAYDISYPEAVRRIEAEVAEMRQTLQSKGQCELNDIGIIRTSIDGHLEFEPCESGILTPSLYGLNTVDITPLASETAENMAIAPTAAKSPVSILTEQPKPEPRLSMTHGEREDMADSEEREEEEERTIRIRVSTIRRVAIVAAVILALFVCVLPFGKIAQPEMSKSYIDTGVLYNILPEALRSVTEKPTHDNMTGKATIEAETIKADKEEIPSDMEHKSAPLQTDKSVTVNEEKSCEAKTFFTIVLASRVTRTNGEAYAKELKRAGFDQAEVIERSNGAKVIYGRFKTQNEAARFLTNLRTAAAAFSEGWVMEVR